MLPQGLGATDEGSWEALWNRQSGMSVQVFGVARQMLSLVAGGAIDEWLLSNLRTLRQEHALARVLAHLQAQLWPGGAWFQSLPENQHPVSLWFQSQTGALSL